MATVTEFENPDLPQTGRKGLAQTSKKNRKKEPQKEPKKFGRPVAEIDWGQVERMANIFTPIPEIAYLLKVSIDTLEKYCKLEHKTTLAVWWKSKAAHGKLSVRKALFQAAVGYENKGVIRNPDGSAVLNETSGPVYSKKLGDYLRNPDGTLVIRTESRPQLDPNPSRKYDIQALLYVTKHVLNLEGTALPYDPEHDEDDEDEREGTDTVYPITFVGDDGDEVAETPAPGEADEADEDDTEYYPDSTGLVPYNPNAQPTAEDYPDYGSSEYGS